MAKMQLIDGKVTFGSETHKAFFKKLSNIMVKTQNFKEKLKNSRKNSSFR